jgi:hypothetical protein
MPFKDIEKNRDYHRDYYHSKRKPKRIQKESYEPEEESYEPEELSKQIQPSRIISKPIHGVTQQIQQNPYMNIRFV